MKFAADSSGTSGTAKASRTARSLLVGALAVATVALLGGCGLLAPPERFSDDATLSDQVHTWQGPRNRVESDPASCPAQILQLRPELRTERQFETYG